MFADIAEGREKETDGWGGTVPTEEMIDRVLAKIPDDCDDEEKEAGRFFFQQVLAVVDANIPKTHIWLENNTYMKVLEGDWYFAVATGYVLISEYADVTNIVYNLDETNKPNTEDDNSTGASSEEGPKKKRARIHTKRKREGMYKRYYHYCKKFRAQMKKENTEATLNKWGKVYGPASQIKNKRKKASDRQQITPREHRADNLQEMEAIDSFFNNGDFQFLGAKETTEESDIVVAV